MMVRGINSPLGAQLLSRGRILICSKKTWIFHDKIPFPSTYKKNGIHTLASWSEN